jgi:rubredoxin
MKFTKVINTYVFESRVLKVQLSREGRIFQQGDLLWIGNKQNNTDGCVMCFQADKTDLRQLVPSEDTCQEIILDTNKEVIKLSIMARYKCSVCGKSMEIFDEVLQCPICDAKAHTEHFKDWIRNKGSCPVCQKPLALNKQDIPIPGDE